jgi:putative FmdB family regulatory protein
MPLYEYQCDACGDRFEKIVKFSDPPLETCPKCGAGPVQKLLSSPAIQFKGSGWYITDYAKKSGDSATGPKSPKSTSEKSESTDSTKSSASTDAPAASTTKE